MQSSNFMPIGPSSPRSSSSQRSPLTEGMPSRVSALSQGSSTASTASPDLQRFSPLGSSVLVDHLRSQVSLNFGADKYYLNGIHLNGSFVRGQLKNIEEIRLLEECVRNEHARANSLSGGNVSVAMPGVDTSIPSTELTDAEMSRLVDDPELAALLGQAGVVESDNELSPEQLINRFFAEEPPEDDVSLQNDAACLTVKDFMDVLKGKDN